MEPWIEPDPGEALTYGHPSRPLGEVLTRRMEPLTGTFGDAQPITVHLDGRVSVRDRLEVYKGAMFLAHAGDVVFSKIDARNGAIGVLPPDIPLAVVTPEFPIYRPDPKALDGRFVPLLLRTGAFGSAIRAKATGTTGRKRITPADFESLRAPLPSLPEQRAMVEAFAAGTAEAEALAQRAEALEAEARAGFEAALGLGAPTPLPDRPVFLARFTDLDRWSHEGVLRRVLGVEAAEAAYPMVQLQEVADVVYGLQKHPGNRPGLNPRPYLRVANVQRGRLVLDEIKLIDVDEPTFHRLRLQSGDLLFVEGNGSRSNLGRVAIWDGTVADAIHQNHLIRARPDTTRLLPEFAAEWFNSDAGRAHFFQQGKTTTGLGTINSNVVKSGPIPLPPTLEEQRALVQPLTDARGQAERLRSEAAAQQGAAWAAFELAMVGAA